MIKTKVVDDGFDNPTVLAYDETPIEIFQWRWEGVLPKAGLVIIAGQSGVGKSSFAMDILARLSKGEKWINEDENSESEGINCLTYSQEETVALVMKSRAIAAGADTSKLFWINDLKFKTSSEIEALIKVIKERKIKAILIDPIVALIKGNTNDLNIVRNSLELINNFALKEQILLIGTTHVSKLSSNYDDELNQIIGSQAFGALARVVIMIKQNKDNSRLMKIIKNNYHPERKELTFKTKTEYIEDSMIDDPIMSSKIILDDSGVTHDDKTSSLDFYKNLVIQELNKGGGMRASTEMMKLLKEHGCSNYTIKKVKDSLNVNSNGKITENNKTFNVWQIKCRSSSDPVRYFV